MTKIIKDYKIAKKSYNSLYYKRKHKKLYNRHGDCGSPTYRSHQAMKARCNNPHNIGYALYGGRGITYQDSWEFYPEFLKDMGERLSGTSLDRIDSDGNYTKENCRWSTKKVQDNNKRNTLFLEYKGETKSFNDWINLLGLNRGLVEKRLNQYNWSVEEAFSKNKRKNPKKKYVLNSTNNKQ